MKPDCVYYFGSRDPVDVDCVLCLEVTIHDGGEKPSYATLHPEYSRGVTDHAPFFNWGCARQGARQFALALLLDFLNGDIARALTLSEYLYRRIISTWRTGADLRITGAWLRVWITDMEAELQAHAEHRRAIDLREGQ